MCQTWREKNFLINEEDFEAKMQETVLPLLKADIREEYFTSRDESRIHTEYMINPDEKAAIVISHGFCEFAGKYHEMMYYMYKCGYSVFFIDHRGHGYSDKCDVDPDMVYVKSFQEYVDSVRFQKACRLIELGGLRLLDVSEESGFSDYRYFSRAFVRRTGKTPEEYRMDLEKQPGYPEHMNELALYARYFGDGYGGESLI